MTAFSNPLSFARNLYQIDFARIAGAFHAQLA
jgi:hypothetical protein